MPKEQSLRSAPSGRNSEQGLAPRSKYSRRYAAEYFGHRKSWVASAKQTGGFHIRNPSTTCGGPPPFDKGGNPPGNLINSTDFSRNFAGEHTGSPLRNRNHIDFFGRGGYYPPGLAYYNPSVSFADSQVTLLSSSTTFPLIGESSLHRGAFPSGKLDEAMNKFN